MPFRFSHGIFACCALVLAAAVGLCWGPGTGWGWPGSGAVLLQLRLPRLVASMATGAGLAVAGAAVQGLFRNPLAEPGLLGLSAGAGLGALLCLVLLGTAGQGLLLPASAALGALLCCGLLLGLHASMRWSGTDRLLLLGLALNSLIAAAMGLLLHIAPDAALRGYTFWTLGSLAGLAPWHATVLGLACLLGLAAAWWLAPQLDVLSLGTAEAADLGLKPATLRWQVALLCSVLVGCSMAFCGLIGFVGLVVPHVLRLLGYARHRSLLAGSALLGAALLPLADQLARSVAAPAELPIGIITALVGAPFFLYLIARQPTW